MDGDRWFKSRCELEGMQWSAEKKDCKGFGTNTILDVTNKPSSMKQAAAWAVADGLLQLPEVDPIDILADQMAQAVREEYKTDSEGRRYRCKQCRPSHKEWGAVHDLGCRGVRAS